jgi:hypothetical protein
MVRHSFFAAARRSPREEVRFVLFDMIADSQAQIAPAESSPIARHMTFQIRCQFAGTAESELSGRAGDPYADTVARLAEFDAALLEKGLNDSRRGPVNVVAPLEAPDRRRRQVGCLRQLANIDVESRSRHPTLFGGDCHFPSHLRVDRVC